MRAYLENFDFLGFILGVLWKISPMAFFKFLKKKKLVQGALTIVMGTLISGIMKKFQEDFIIPFATRKWKKLGKSFKTLPKVYPALFINFFFGAYTLYILIQIM